jgi:hypothetical protein
MRLDDQSQEKALSAGAGAMPRKRSQIPTMSASFGTVIIEFLSATNRPGSRRTGALTMIALGQRTIFLIHSPSSLRNSF